MSISLQVVIGNAASFTNVYIYTIYTYERFSCFMIFNQRILFGIITAVVLNQGPQQTSTGIQENLVFKLIHCYH